MSTFSGELLRFIGELRLAEVRVSVAETLDAMRAAAAIGLSGRTRVREALAAALVKDEADRESFDEVFTRFFGAGALAPIGALPRRMAGAAIRERRPRRAPSALGLTLRPTGARCQARPRQRQKLSPRRQAQSRPPPRARPNRALARHIPRRWAVP